MKSWISHVAFAACERCIVVGGKVDNNTVFLFTNEPKITDADFRAFKYTDRHIDTSLCTEIEPPVNMINQFVLDPIHLAYLNVVAGILEYFLSSK